MGKPNVNSRGELVKPDAITREPKQTPHQNAVSHGRRVPCYCNREECPEDRSWPIWVDDAGDRFFPQVLDDLDCPTCGSPGEPRHPNGPPRT